MLAGNVVKSICCYGVAFLTPQINSKPKLPTAFVNINCRKPLKTFSRYSPARRRCGNGEPLQDLNLRRHLCGQKNTRKRQCPSRVLNVLNMAARVIWLISRFHW